MKTFDAIMQALRQLSTDPGPLAERLYSAEYAIKAWLSRSADPVERRKMLQALDKETTVASVRANEFWLKVRNSIAQRLNQ